MIRLYNNKVVVLSTKNYLPTGDLPKGDKLITKLYGRKIRTNKAARQHRHHRPRGPWKNYVDCLDPSRLKVEGFYGE